MLLVTASDNLSCTEGKQTLFLFPSLLILVQPTTLHSMHSRPHRCSTNFWAAAVTLALGQRTSIVSSYQNHASPQPRTAVSHCGLDNVSNVKKYKKSHCAFWESQDIVHTVTFRGAMVVYNRTITEKFTTNYFTSSGTSPSG